MCFHTVLPRPHGTEIMGLPKSLLHVKCYEDEFTSLSLEPAAVWHSHLEGSIAREMRPKSSEGDKAATQVNRQENGAECIGGKVKDRSGVEAKLDSHSTQKTSVPVSPIQSQQEPH
ncbi:hypothetical protein H8959_004224 [Pygathrix nigripes]